MNRATSFAVNGRCYRIPRGRVLAICGDGWDPRYLDHVLEIGAMPRLQEVLHAGGDYRLASAQVPTFTNPNNASIVTGVSAAVHGISGNHYRDTRGVLRQMTDPRDLRADTIHAAAQEAGVRAVCVTAKDKLRRLLSAGNVPAFSAERADQQTLAGRAVSTLIAAPTPSIYDWRLSPYTVELALALSRELDAHLVYASLTDYVPHTAAPDDPLTTAFFAAMDRVIGLALDAGYLIGITADHGMNAKTGADSRPNIQYLDDALRRAGVQSGDVVLPITDPYVAHHAGLGSCAYVYVDAAERDRAAAVLTTVAGVEHIFERQTAVDVLELPGDRIGDLVVLGDDTTVFGRGERDHDLSQLTAPLRSHGGLHEQRVPLLTSRRVTSACTAPLRNRDLHDLLLNHVEE